MEPHAVMPKTRRRRRRPPQRGRGLLAVLGKAVAAGYQLGKDKRYKRMGAKGVTGHYEAPKYNYGMMKRILKRKPWARKMVMDRMMRGDPHPLKGL